METNQKKSIFEGALLQTKVRSANVKTQELAIGYFVGPFFAIISNAIFGSYLNRYYSDVIGWTDTSRFGSFSALLPMISVICVVLGNLLIGRLIDNTRTPAGKARPFLLASAPLVALAIFLLFMVPLHADPKAQMIYLAISYNIYYAICYPMYYTAHSSMVNLSTRNTRQRGLLATLSNASGVAAIGVGASIIVPIVLQSWLFVSKDGHIDTDASYAHWRILMLALVVVTFLAILLEYFYTRERITEENLKLNITEKKIAMAEQVRVCVREPYWWMIILYFLLFQFGGMVKNGSMSFYCRWMFDGVTTEGQAGSLMGILGLVGGLPTALGMVIAWPIADKLGKRNAVLYGMIISVLGGAVSFLNVHSFPIVVAGVVLKGVGSIPGMYVTLAILSDVLDHLEARNGFRSDGFTMSVYGAIMVGMSGLGNGVINLLLTSAGYAPQAAAQSPAVQRMLAICYLGVELVCYAINVFVLLGLKVERHIQEDQATIVEHQKAAVLAAGGEWVEPAERLRREQEEADRQAEEARIAELKETCRKKGLDFDAENQKYLQEQEKKKNSLIGKLLGM